MKKVFFFVVILFASITFNAGAQTLDTAALGEFQASTVREVFDVARYVKLDAATQVALARAFEAEDDAFVKGIAAEGGVMSVKLQRKLDKMRDKTLARLLTADQLAQYYRGVYDAEANAEGIAVANTLQKKYNLTDQNWKFIRIAFYKIGLESRVLKKTMADEPAKAKKAIEKIRTEMMNSIEEKGGIRVDDDMTVTVTRPFNPNTLRKE